MPEAYITIVRCEIFTLATIPAAGNAGRIILVIDAPAGSQFQGDNGVVWVLLG
jgi:hypothetical protein